MNPLSPMIEESILYLKSPAALQSVSVDVYWPKWSAPWWHMALLHEMGLGDRIPPEIALHMASRLREQLLPLFFDADVPVGRDPRFDTPCPCALGNIFQILTGAGIDMDKELPWARSWFLKYQMDDGGLSCDQDAYHSSPQASSIVGTIAPLEAILFCTRRPFSAEEERFLDQGAQCLIGRKLMNGCAAGHNAEEKLDEEAWLKLCFPRFYLYDVLRGLHFLLEWSRRRGKTLPLESISGALQALESKFPDGEIRLERHSYEGVGTRFLSSGKWEYRSDANFFPLLHEVSRIGAPSPELSAQWAKARETLTGLIAAGLAVRSGE